MIFYERSPRYVEDKLNPQELEKLSGNVHRVGVFVDACPERVIQRSKDYGLHAIQLHGQESPEYCRAIKEHGLQVIKAFPVANADDLQATDRYEGLCDYLLFDTRTPAYGGSGQQFDWQMLEAYTGRTPFLLSGGIAADNATRIRAIAHPQLAGVDLNSRFELSPGKKDIEMLCTFINELNKTQTI